MSRYQHGEAGTPFTIGQVGRLMANSTANARLKLSARF